MLKKVHKPPSSAAFPFPPKHDPRNSDYFVFWLSIIIFIPYFHSQVLGLVVFFESNVPNTSRSSVVAFPTAFLLSELVCKSASLSLPFAQCAPFVSYLQDFPLQTDPGLRGGNLFCPSRYLIPQSDVGFGSAVNNKKIYEKYKKSEWQMKHNGKTNDGDKATWPRCTNGIP